MTELVGIVEAGGDEIAERFDGSIGVTGTAILAGLG